ncbi:hypothetical protein MKW94_026176 [Papaver nudicaule]|uniref:Uncharacterized protein n=1 Tax=Papaver nudicaule TaxID=74823 RepID=A0AA41W0R1_PAPNU|nr:hypothetical protein [Papaver nudicaule]
MNNSISVLTDSNENNSGSSIEQQENSTPEITALRRLSINLESVFQSTDFDFCSDAKIILSDSREIPIHRVILSARSPFFKSLFNDSKDERKFELKKLMSVDVGFDSLSVVLSYLYNGKVKPLPREVCACVDEECEHIGCRPVVDLMIQVLYASFVFQIPELVSLFQRRLLDILGKVTVDDIMVILSVANMCDKHCERLVMACIDIVVKSDLDPVTLEKGLPQDIVKQVMDSRLELGLVDTEIDEKAARRIRTMHKALDWDDVELIEKLLKEGNTSLDEANALHYAVAYSDAKTTEELLKMGLADVNRKNQRGYTVLHIAAMRKDPGIIASIVTKGARPTDLTPDGRKALQIAKRLTRWVEYHKFTERGQSAPKERLCIEILEQAETNEPLGGEASLSLAMAGDDLRERWVYLENRVKLAKLFFPEEAQVAMDIAQVKGTLEFLADANCKELPGGEIVPLNLNEAPFFMEELHHKRIGALSRMVDFGKKYFPRCSNVLNKIVDTKDLLDLADLKNGSSEEQQLKKKRFLEIQDSLKDAFDKDKVEYDQCKANSASSSSASKGLAQRQDKSSKKRKK